MASLRNLVSAVISDAIASRNIRLIDQPSVVNLWASCVTVTDEITFSLGSIRLMEASTMNIRAAAVGLVQTKDDQLIFNLIVLPGSGDLEIGFPTLTTSAIFLLSVEPLT